MSATNETHKHHILPFQIYMNVFIALLVLTAITVWVSYMDFGVFNLLVAMIVAVIKASLVAMFFMHLKYDNKLYTISFLLSIFLLGVFIILTLFDTMRRGDIYEIKQHPIDKNAAMYDNRPPADSSAAQSTGH